MQTIIVFCLLGLGPGALIAGLALGVVMVHRASSVINFAMGVVAAWGAYVFYGLVTGGWLWLPPLPLLPDHIQLGGPWPQWAAALTALACCAALGLLTEVAVIRPLRRQSPLAKLLGSLGVYLFLQAVLTVRFGTSGRQAPEVLPAGTASLFGVAVPVNRFVLFGLVGSATVILALAYRRTRFGLAVRAAAENETTASLYALDPNRLSLVNVIGAYVLVGGLGILVAPLVTLDPVSLPNLIIPALAAALLAGFSSFGVALAAGVGMGVIQSVLTFLEAHSWFPHAGGVALPGVDDLLFLLLIIGAMVWRGRRLPARGGLVEPRLPAAPAPRRVAAPALVGLGVCTVAFLVLPFDWRQAAINSLIGIIVCLSLVVIIGFVGQVSLVQLGLAGVAGFVVSKLAEHAGVGFPLAPVLGIAAATVLGVLIALAALRVRGVNLAIVTLAAAVALGSFGFSNVVWGAGTTGSPVPSPRLFGLDLGVGAPFPINGRHQPSPVFGLVCALCVVLACILVSNLRTSRLGKDMLSVRSNERAAAAAGIHVVRVKLTAFALSSALAGLAGVLFAYNFQTVTAERFSFATALSTVAFAYIGGITTVRGAVIGGVGVTGGVASLVISMVGVPAGYQFVFGGLLLVIVLITKPEGLAGSPPSLPLAPLARRFVARRADRGQLAAGRSDGAPAEHATIGAVTDHS